MSRPLADWLALREDADAAARSDALARAVAARLPPGAPARVLDLATGTGSNIRYLAPRLSGDQRWVAADRDRVLLARVPPEVRGPSFAAHVETRAIDLGRPGDPAIPLLLNGHHLVTASALLDLVSDRWLRALAALCRASGAIVLFALTYTGESACEPAEPEDDLIRRLMNRHQRASDHGFGTAAGPDALDCAIRAFAEAGYDMQRERSDWRLLPEHRALQSELVEGWALAAREIAPEHAATIAGWRSRRLAHVEAGRSRITVGHEDIAGWL